MKRYSSALLFALTAAFLWSPSARSQDQPDARGAWDGYIEIETMKLLISLELTHRDQGGWTGTITIPAQGIKDALLEKVNLNNGAISFLMPNRPGDPSFTGQVSGAGKNITGEFNQSGRTFPFAVERPGAAAAGRYGPTPDKGISGQGLEGNWQGTLDAGGSTMRLVLKVTKCTEQGFTARVDSPDQSILDLPVDVTKLRGSVLQFEMKRLGASYSGTLDADASEIAGEWQQSGASLDVRFKRLGVEPGR
jgi:hypothetical protein